MTPTRRNAERLRLLGLRRAVHFTTAGGSGTPTSAPKPGSVKPGTTPKAAK